MHLDRLLLRDAEKFLMDDLYSNPGPIQYRGPGADSKTICLSVEDQDYMGRVKELQAYLDKVLFNTFLFSISFQYQSVCSFSLPFSLCCSCFFYLH